MAPPSEEVVPPRQRTRSWPRRLLIAANIVVALCVVTTAGGYGYVRWKFGQIDTIDDLGDVLRRGGGDDVPIGEPMNVLVVGSDTRENIDQAGTDNFGGTKEVKGQRSDTIILLRVDPKKEQAAMLSIPRDLYVPIAGTNRSNRINTAFEAGEGRLIETVNEALGIPIDHYVQVDFNGLRGIVGAVGGVQIYSPARARDTVTGLNIPNPGCVTLDGNQALAYVRAGQYQYFENGKWRYRPDGRPRPHPAPAGLRPPCAQEGEREGSRPERPGDHPARGQRHQERPDRQGLRGRATSPRWPTASGRSTPTPCRC